MEQINNSKQRREQLFNTLLEIATKKYTIRFVYQGGNKMRMYIYEGVYTGRNIALNAFKCEEFNVNKNSETYTLKRKIDTLIKFILLYSNILTEQKRIFFNMLIVEYTNHDLKDYVKCEAIQKYLVS